MAPLQRLSLPEGAIQIQRDDLLHPVISGNKWRKLKGWLRRARSEGKTAVLTFGGAFSNHLAATACLAHSCGLESLGVVRGEEPMENPWLAAARGYGMKICQVSRGLYRDKNAALESVRAALPNGGWDWERTLIIAEGGCGPEGFEGFEDLVEGWLGTGFRPEAVLHASATATTATGLVLALRKVGLETRVLAVTVLENLQEQQRFAAEHGAGSGIEWITGHTFGGFAKAPEAIRVFCRDFTARHGIPCEPVYTGKALHALTVLLKTRQLSPDGLVFLHTGGLPAFTPADTVQHAIFQDGQGQMEPALAGSMQAREDTLP